MQLQVLLYMKIFALEQQFPLSVLCCQANHWSSLQNSTSLQTTLNVLCHWSFRPWLSHVLLMFTAVVKYFILKCLACCRIFTVIWFWSCWLCCAQGSCWIIYNRSLHRVKRGCHGCNHKTLKRLLFPVPRMFMPSLSFYKTGVLNTALHLFSFD